MIRNRKTITIEPGGKMFPPSNIRLPSPKPFFIYEEKQAWSLVNYKALFFNSGSANENTLQVLVLTQ